MVVGKLLEKFAVEVFRMEDGGEAIVCQQVLDVLVVKRFPLSLLMQGEEFEHQGVDCGLDERKPHGDIGVADLCGKGVERGEQQAFVGQYKGGLFECPFLALQA